LGVDLTSLFSSPSIVVAVPGTFGDAKPALVDSVWKQQGQSKQLEHLSFIFVIIVFVVVISLICKIQIVRTYLFFLRRTSDEGKFSIQLGQ